MNRLLKRIGTLGAGVGMLLANFIPAVGAFATDYGTGSYELTASVDSNADWVTSFTIDGKDFGAADRYFSEDDSYFMTFELHIPNDEVKDNVGIRTGGGSGAFDLQLAGPIEDWEGTHKKYVYTANYVAPAQVSHVSFNPYSENGGGEPGEPGGDFIVNVTGLSEEDGAIFVDEVDEDTVAVTFGTLWHMKFVGDITVNGQVITVADYIDYDDQLSYLQHYDRQIVRFTEEFARADDDVYNITVATARNEVHHIGNFLWTADPAQADGEDYIGNAKMEPVSVSFSLGGVDYVCDGNSTECPFVEFSSGSETYDDGSLVVPAGALITMRVTPDYGYQVMNVNMSELTTSDDV